MKKVLGKVINNKLLEIVDSYEVISLGLKKIIALFNWIPNLYFAESWF